MTDIAIAERITTLTPLGIRFWDEAMRAPVQDGLRVTVTPEGRRARTARRSASGTWWVSDLPGLLEVEQGDGTDTWWAQPHPSVACHVHVEDPLGRYLPCEFDVDAPHRRALLEPCTPPAPRLGPRLGVPLFATAARPVPSGRAVLRALLWDQTADAPARGAIAEVRLGTAPLLLGRGMSGDDGQVLVLFDWPPLRPQAGPGQRDALTSQSWTLELTVRYDGAATAPDLCTRLGQDAATVIDLDPDPLVLSFGEELVVRSAPQSVLLVRP